MTVVFNDEWSQYLSTPEGKPTAEGMARSIFDGDADRLADYEIGELRLPAGIERELDKLLKTRDQDER